MSESGPCRERAISLVSRFSALFSNQRKRLGLCVGSSADPGSRLQLIIVGPSPRLSIGRLANTRSRSARTGAAWEIPGVDSRRRMARRGAGRRGVSRASTGAAGVGPLLARDRHCPPRTVASDASDSGQDQCIAAQFAQQSVPRLFTPSAPGRTAPAPLGASKSRLTLLLSAGDVVSPMFGLPPPVLPRSVGVLAGSWARVNHRVVLGRRRGQVERRPCAGLRACHRHSERADREQGHCVSGGRTRDLHDPVGPDPVRRGQVVARRLPAEIGGVVAFVAFVALVAFVAFVALVAFVACVALIAFVAEPAGRRAVSKQRCARSIGVARARDLAELFQVDLLTGDRVVAQPVARQRALLDQLVAAHQVTCGNRGPRCRKNKPTSAIAVATDGRRRASRLIMLPSC